MFWQERKLPQVYRDNEAAETSEELCKTLQLTILELKKKAPYGSFWQIRADPETKPCCATVC